jgi:hypothetical protein
MDLYSSPVKCKEIVTSIREKFWVEMLYVDANYVLSLFNDFYESNGRMVMKKM